MTHPIKPNPAAATLSEPKPEEQPCDATQDTCPRPDLCPVHGFGIPDASKAGVEEQTLGIPDAPADHARAVRQNGLQSRYVVGFMFDLAFERVALIRKNKPEWQAGLLNGIGGKIEDGEDPFDAMAREFIEEAGLGGVAWWNFATLSGRNNDGNSFALECFWASGRLSLVRAQESEQIEIIDVKTLSERPDTIGNLPWLIMLARDCGNGASPPRIVRASYGPSVVNGNDAGAPTGASSKTSALAPSVVEGVGEKENPLGEKDAQDQR